MARPRPAAPPGSEDELMARARALAGQPLAEVARGRGIELPRDPVRAKGWTGALVEHCLGASAGALAEPDFPHLGIELKTLPLDARGGPRETTWVCVLPASGEDAGSWERSWVRRKLARVLWLPFQADPALDFAERRFGSPLLWRPEPDLEAVLKQDWEEIMDMVVSGGLEQLSARTGTYLQVRPKAAHSRSRARGVDAAGAPAPTLPRGFYLRTAFTREILARHYLSY